MDKNTYISLANAIGSFDWDRADQFTWDQYRIKQFPSTAFDSDYRCYCIEWDDADESKNAQNPTMRRMVAKITSRNEISALNLLSKNNFPVPHIICSVPGSNGNYMLFQQWVPGKELYACRTEDAWISAVCALSNIHTKFFEGEQVPVAGPWAITGGNGVLQRIQNAFCSVNNCRPWNVIMEEFKVRMEVAPKTLIHGDMFPTNVMTDGRGGIAFIDWADSAVLPYMLDIGRMIGTVDKQTLQPFCPCEEAVLKAYYERMRGKLNISYAQFKHDAYLAKFMELAGCYSPSRSAFIDKDFNKAVGEQLSETAKQLGNSVTA